MKRFTSFLGISLFFAIQTHAQNTFPTSGSVGIGTTTPATRLFVRGSRVADYGLVAVQDADGSGMTGQAFVSFFGNDNVRMGYFGPSFGSFVVSNDVRGTNGNGNKVVLSPDNGKVIVGGAFTDFGAQNFQVYGSTYLSGQVGIGTRSPGTFQLAVEGRIGAREVVVTAQNPWPDYVFSNSYNLMPLSQVKDFIKSHHHLPGMPDASSVEKNGIELGEMNSLLLKKIEELTLYLLELKKENEEIKSKLEELKK